MVLSLIETSVLGLSIATIVILSFVLMLNWKVSNSNKRLKALVKVEALSQVTGHSLDQIWRTRSSETKVALVVPARNEERNLGRVLDTVPRVEGYVFLPVVVDDGSTDKTAEVANRHNALVVKHSVNLGIGAALKTGYSIAKKIGADIIIQVDADGEHDPKIIPTMLSKLNESEQTMVVGSRFMSGKPDIPKIRKIGIEFFTRIACWLTGYKITDVTNGLRAFRVSDIEYLNFESDSHWALEMTLLARRSGILIKEFPVDYVIRSSGKSQFSDLSVLIKYPFVMFRQILSFYI